MFALLNVDRKPIVYVELLVAHMFAVEMLSIFGITGKLVGRVAWVG